MTVLYFDCFSGASGDMILGALIDAGVAIEDVRAALGSLAIEPDAVWTHRVIRAGISATKFSVRGEDLDTDGEQDTHRHGRHSHRHAHGRHVHSHPPAPGRGLAVEDEGDEADELTSDAPAMAAGHRTLDAIYQLIDRSALSGAGKDRAKQLFHRLGEAESAIHGTPLDRVHLHEVGALDSIIDIVGVVFALEQLNVDRIVSSPLNVGSGTVRASHGVYPVPAPATLRLLQGAPIYAGASAAELVTPTGALLITSYATAFGTLPSMIVKRIGYGAGSRDFTHAPNVLRVLIGDEVAATAAGQVVVIEAEIDDMNPQIFGVVMDRLLADGALDVFYTPIQMKKNRPGTLLTIIAPPAARERLTALVFRETTTIGVRYTDMNRDVLDRETIEVTTPYGIVRFKVARRNGLVLNASPEFDDCVRIASQRGVPVKDVQALAAKAFLDLRKLTES